MGRATRDPYYYRATGLKRPKFEVLCALRSFHGCTLREYQICVIFSRLTHALHNCAPIVCTESFKPPTASPTNRASSVTTKKSPHKKLIAYYHRPPPNAHSTSSITSYMQRSEALHSLTSPISTASPETLTAIWWTPELTKLCDYRNSVKILKHRTRNPHHVELCDAHYHKPLHSTREGGRKKRMYFLGSLNT